MKTEAPKNNILFLAPLEIVRNRSRIVQIGDTSYPPQSEPTPRSLSLAWEKPCAVDVDGGASRVFSRSSVVYFSYLTSLPK